MQRKARLKAEADRLEYEEKKLKMQKAMGEDLHKDRADETEDSRQRRLNMIRHAPLQALKSCLVCVWLPYLALLWAYFLMIQIAVMQLGTINQNLAPPKLAPGFSA